MNTYITSGSVMRVLFFVCNAQRVLSYWYFTPPIHTASDADYTSSPPSPSVTPDTPPDTPHTVPFPRDTTPSRVVGTVHHNRVVPYGQGIPRG